MSSLSSRFVLRAARPIPVSRQLLQRTTIRRSVHSDASPHDTCLPFSTHSRKGVAVKCLVFMGGAFSIPWVAIWWHWNRPGGINNP